MESSNDNNVLFYEKQRFRQPWIWIIVTFVCLYLTGYYGYGMIQQLFLCSQWGDNPMSDRALLIVGSLFVVSGISFFILIYCLQLITEVRPDGVYFRFSPLHRSVQKIPFDSIKKYEVRTYQPIREYGGWGIRYGRGGKAYNVSGNKGVQFELINGKRILIGSQRADEFAGAVKSVLK